MCGPLGVGPWLKNQRVKPSHFPSLTRGLHSLARHTRHTAAAIAERCSPFYVKAKESLTRFLEINAGSPPVSSCHRSGNNPKFPGSAKFGPVGLPPPFAATAPIAACAVAEPQVENDLAPGTGTGISTAATAATCAGLRVARFRGGGARRTFSPLSAA